MMACFSTMIWKIDFAKGMSAQLSQIYLGTSVTARNDSVFGRIEISDQWKRSNGVLDNIQWRPGKELRWTWWINYYVEIRMTLQWVLIRLLVWNHWKVSQSTMVEYQNYANEGTKVALREYWPIKLSMTTKCFPLIALVGRYGTPDSRIPQTMHG